MVLVQIRKASVWVWSAWALGPYYFVVSSVWNSVCWAFSDMGAEWAILLVTSALSWQMPMSNATMKENLPEGELLLHPMGYRQKSSLTRPLPALMVPYWLCISSLRTFLLILPLSGTLWVQVPGEVIHPWWSVWAQPLFEGYIYIISLQGRVS